MVGSCFLNQSATLCILLGEFNLFTLRLIIDREASMVAQTVKSLAAMQEIQVRSLGLVDKELLISSYSLFSDFFIVPFFLSPCSCFVFELIYNRF